MVPVAPGLLSTRKDWLVCAPICVPTMRAMMSAPPPAAKPTAIFTGLSGYAAARTGSAAEASAAAAAPRAVRRFMFMLVSRVLLVPRHLGPAGPPDPQGSATFNR